MVFPRTLESVCAASAVYETAGSLPKLSQFGRFPLSYSKSATGGRHDAARGNAVRHGADGNRLATGSGAVGPSAFALGHAPGLPIEPLHLQAHDCHDQGCAFAGYDAIDRLPMLQQALLLLIAAEVPSREARITRVRLLDCPDFDRRVPDPLGLGQDDPTARGDFRDPNVIRDPRSRLDRARRMFEPGSTGREALRARCLCRGSDRPSRRARRPRIKPRGAEIQSEPRPRLPTRTHFADLRSQ